VTKDDAALGLMGLMVVFARRKDTIPEMLMLWPKKFYAAIPWFGALMVAEGIILLVHGLRLGLGPFPFYGDVSACLLGGVGILCFARAAKP